MKPDPAREVPDESVPWIGQYTGAGVARLLQDAGMAIVYREGPPA